MNTLTEQKTAVQILSSRVHALEKSLANCREASRKMAAQLLCVMDAQEKMGNPVKIRVPDEIRKDRCRDKHAINRRFAIWRVMWENGMTDSEISKEYGVDRHAVQNARLRGWKSAYSRDWE